MRPLIALLPILALIAGCDRQSGDAPQPAPTQSAGPVKTETAGTLDISKRGTDMPTEAFRTPDGKSTTLADFKGKPVLVNLWATWCGPCVAEMPTLDDLAQRTAGKLQVLVVSQDMDKVDILPFFAKGGYKALKPYRDPEAGLGFAFNSGMLPTTVLYDAQGKEVWRVVGAMDWDGPRANTLLADVTG